MNHWIDRPHNDSHTAYQCMDGGGYIPFAPFGGLHVMDDFGNLVEVCTRGYQDITSIPPMFPTFEPFFCR